MKGWTKLFTILLIAGFLMTPAYTALASAGSIQTPNQSQQSQLTEAWSRTYVIISLNNIKMIKDWDYIFKTLPPQSKGIMIMWYGITQDYQHDFNITQDFINQYHSKFPHKDIIELYMNTSLPAGNNQTVHVVTPIFDHVNYVITFDNVSKLIDAVPKNKNIKIIGSYIYEVQKVPVNGTNQTETVVNEKPKWDEIVKLHKKDPRFTGLMIYTNDNKALPEIISKAKHEGFTTYTIILPNPTLFGGIDMFGTYQKILGALKYYDYILFYSWSSITPDFNYYMTGGNKAPTHTLPGDEINEAGKWLRWLPELLLAFVVIAGVIYAIVRKKSENKKKEKLDEEEDEKPKKKKKKKKSESEE